MKSQFDKTIVQFKTVPHNQINRETSNNQKTPYLLFKLQLHHQLVGLNLFERFCTVGL